MGGEKGENVEEIVEKNIWPQLVVNMRAHAS